MNFRFANIRVFIMRQKRQINFLISFGVIAAILVVLYSLSSKPAVSQPHMAEELEGKVTMEQDIENQKNEPSPKQVEPEPISQKPTEVNKEVKEDEDLVIPEKQEPTPPAVSVKSPEPQRAATTKKTAFVNKIPEAIIIGVHICRTKFLADLLNQHSEISVVYGSEFYNMDTNYKKGKGWYLDHLPHIPKSNILVERSTRYYASVAAPQRIHKMNPKTKLILMACDPVKRAIGAYRSKKMDDETLEAFENLVLHSAKKEINEKHDLITDSIYHKHIKAWLEYFPKSQILFLDDISLLRQVNNQLRLLEDFLGVDHEISKGEIYYNATRGTKCGRFNGEVVCFGVDRNLRPPNVEISVDPDVITQLKSYFKTHNEEFFKRVGKKFEW